VTPAPTDSNLASLAHTLCSAAPRLRAHDVAGSPITLGPDIIRAIPELPLTTHLGDLNILMHPVGAPTDYDELRDDASTVELDTVPTLIPTIDALLRGLAGGSRQPHPELLDRLRHLANSEPAEPPPAFQAPRTEAEQRHELERAILETLNQLGHPASIRDLLFAMNTRRRPPYKQVKIAAESLTAHRRLLRDKEGTAHRYRLNTGTEDHLARQVADLLTRADDVDATIARAVRLIARDGPGDSSHPGDRVAAADDERGLTGC
jgi:predicted transcriptional regulator